MTNLHSALKTEVIQQSTSDGLRAVLVRLQHGRDQISHSLHVHSSSFTSYGIQMTDLLSMLGFARSRCTFVNGECYAKEVDVSFDVNAFAAILVPMRQALFNAQQHFEKCGFFIEQPEGWGYYTGQRSRTSRRGSYHAGDGHTGQQIERMKESEDDAFRFVFTWVVGDRQRGWTTHYNPVHPPLSIEVQSIFEFLQLRHFDSCPEFDFESCYWRFTPFDENADRDFFNRPADKAHSWFYAHREHFSTGVESLLAANEMASRFDLRLLPAPKQPTPRLAVSTPSLSQVSNQGDQQPGIEYDVALSFAGPQRELAEKLATIVKDAGFNVFYDAFYPEQLWGKDLVEFFDEVYRKQSRFCVMFISEEYRDRIWTTHERRSALARALEERGGDYLLPIRIENTDVDGLRPTLAYLSIDNYSIEQIAEILINKLRN